jgi:hypothetical protein
MTSAATNAADTGAGTTSAADAAVAMTNAATNAADTEAVTTNGAINAADEGRAANAHPRACTRPLIRS